MWHGIPVIDTSRTDCRKLRKITLRTGKTIPQVPEFKNLLISYGAQLEEADLSYFSTAACAELVTQCPNVLCSLKIVGYESGER